MSRKELLIIVSFLIIAAITWHSIATTKTRAYVSPGPARPNGTYELHVRSGDTWKKAGNLSFDQYYLDREIDLGGMIAGRGETTIKLCRKGGGASQIDAVSLGEVPPKTVSFPENGLRKITQKDFDVINVAERDFEMTFPAERKNSRFRLTARVEGETVDEVPFEFPLENLYGTVTPQSKFYSYTLDSERGGCVLDGVLKEVRDRKPLVETRINPSSGHPSGVFYAWVWNDDKNLYSAVDFTSDNTMDDDADYVTVHVNGGAVNDGVRSFKVSRDETSWGVAAFTYTGRVPYQHKVYEFSIPLDKAGIGRRGNGGNLELAFTAYGTVAAPREFIQFTNSTYTVNENDGVATITVMVAGNNGPNFGNEEAYTEVYTTAGSATAVIDYTEIPAGAHVTLTWPWLDPADKTFTVTIADDPEPDETINLYLTNIHSEFGYTSPGNPVTATLTII